MIQGALRQEQENGQSIDEAAAGLSPPAIGKRSGVCREWDTGCTQMIRARHDC